MGHSPLLAFFATSPSEVTLLLQMLIVIGAATLLAEIAEHFRLPGIVGGLLGGVLVGPSALGLVQSNELLEALATLGVMFLLFEVGLHVKVSDLLRVGQMAMLVAILGVIVPFVLGWAILSAAKHPQIEAIFIGAAMVATSVGITAEVLKSKGLLDHQTARVILAAAIIDDVLGLLVLAVVSSMGEGKGIDFVGLITSSAVSIGFVVAVVKFGTPAINLVFPKLKSFSRLKEFEFTTAILFLFSMALLATYSGVAGIIGAFLAGMALAESVSHRTTELVHGAAELTVPFFLASIGLAMDLSVFTKPSTLALALAILIAAVLSKAVGCGAGAWKLGMRNATRIGIGMVPRGEVGMVVAQVGLAGGAISQDAYGVAVFMAVATTIVAPPMLNFAYRDISQPPATAALSE